MERVKIENYLNEVATSGDHADSLQIAAAQALATFHLADMLADVGPALERMTVEHGAISVALDRFGKRS